MGIRSRIRSLGVQTLTPRRPEARPRGIRSKKAAILQLLFWLFVAVVPTIARPAVVVIDPGHGGIDRGGIPGVRLSEKDLTLDTAKRLSRILRANSGIKVVMTRNEDTFVSLGARTAIANRYARANAVFVSIHYNVGLREGAYGIETYYNNRGAYRLAVLIHSRVIQAADSIDRGIRHRGYRVLRANRLPAILIECGFMTNRAEAARIRSARYRDRIAKAIADGLLE